MLFISTSWSWWWFCSLTAQRTKKGDDPPTNQQTVLLSLALFSINHHSNYQMITRRNSRPRSILYMDWRQGTFPHNFLNTRLLWWIRNMCNLMTMLHARAFFPQPNPNRWILQRSDTGVDRHLIESTSSTDWSLFGLLPVARSAVYLHPIN